MLKLFSFNLNKARGLLGISDTEDLMGLDEVTLRQHFANSQISVHSQPNFIRGNHNVSRPVTRTRGQELMSEKYTRPTRYSPLLEGILLHSIGEARYDIIDRARRLGEEH